MTDGWPTCDEVGCSGACTSDATSCLAHVRADERGATLKRFSESGELDVRGVTISDALFGEILNAAPHDTDGHLAFSAARFAGATFKGAAEFGGATFEASAEFGKATFKGAAGFGKATFKGAAEFGGATFEASAEFGKATFEGAAGFGKATFEGDAWFSETTFKRNTWFGKATFKGAAEFGESAFKGDVPVLGPIAVGGSLNLDGVQFASLVRIETHGGAVTCRRGRFPGGVRFDVRYAEVRLDDTDLSVPSLLTGPAGALDPRNTAEIIAGTGLPWLLSLQGANVAGLTLGNVNLALCRFAGAHNLDKLRLEAGTFFGLSPAVAGWERRQVIAEEVAWRAARRPADRMWTLWWRLDSDYKPVAGWERRQVIAEEVSEEFARRAARRPADRMSTLWRLDSDDKPEVLSPGAVAVLYRALRKSREDAKDEPGAADFYYGEMEMRRHDRYIGSKWRGLVSRGVLTAYWLLSGYGLRAWRSLAALAVVVFGLAAGFWLVGFTRSTTYWKSLLFAFRSTISLTDAQVNLTAWGGLFQAILRLTGPVLLALTLLALRGRVKR